MLHTITPEEIIEKLNLEKHCEGGYFYQTHRSNKNFITAENKNRCHLSVISLFDGRLITIFNGYVNYLALKNAAFLLRYHHDLLFNLIKTEFRHQESVDRLVYH